MMPINIVTFNYDRSLEYFLWNAIQSTFRCPKDHAFALISEMNIIHFYGSLGPIYGENAIPYGGENVNDAAKNIKVIPHEKSDHATAELSEDQTKSLGFIHEHNKTIVYMDFGFDEQNCNLLKLHSLPKSHSIYGTTFGLTPFEKIQVGRKYFNIEGSRMFDQFTSENYGCMELIRNKPIFDL